MDKELNDKYLSQMKELRYEDDTEHAHVVADEILCNLLDELGYKELVDAFDDLDRWYS